MNINIPLIYCYIDNSYIFKNKTKQISECIIFGATSLHSYSLMFHCQLNFGAIYYRLPIWAFQHKQIVKNKLSLNELQPWDCPSNNVEMIIYDWLYNQRVVLLSKLGYYGEYICTFDFYGKGTTAEIPHEHKCLHLIKLDNGQFGLFPNTHLLFLEPSNVKISKEYKHLKSNKNYFSVEQFYDKNKK